MPNILEYPTRPTYPMCTRFWRTKCTLSTENFALRALRDCLNSTLASPNCPHPRSSLPDFNLSFLLIMSFPKQCSGVTLSFYGLLQNHQPTTGHRTPAGLPAIIDHQPIDHIRMDPGYLQVLHWTSDHRSSTHRQALNRPIDHQPLYLKSS